MNEMIIGIHLYTKQRHRNGEGRSQHVYFLQPVLM